MQLKKILKGAALMAAIAAALAFPGTVKAEETTGTHEQVGINYIDFCRMGGELLHPSLYLDLDPNVKELLIGVGKVNKKTKKITVASWDTYDIKGNNDFPYYRFNLYKKMSVARDNYIVLKNGVTSSACIIKKAKGKKIIKAKYDPITGKVRAGSGNSAGEVVLKDVPTEGQTVTGYTFPMTDLTDEGKGLSQKNIDYCRVSGATAYIYDYGSGGTGEQDLNETYTFENQQLKVYNFGTMPSKAVKLRIPAQAKGPKLGADYVNGTIRFPRNSEYRISTSKGVQQSVDDKYTAAPEGFTSVEDFIKAAKTAGNLTDNDSKFNLEVRIAATDKKIASKWSHLFVEEPSVMSDSELKKVGDQLDNKPVPQPGEIEQKSGGKGVAEAIVNEGTTKVLDISYVKKGNISDTRQQENAVKIKNSGKLTYDIVIGQKGATQAPTDVKAVKVGPYRTAVITNDAEDGATVWIRKSGNKKTNTWAGIYKKLGVIDYRFVVPAKEK